MSRTYHGANSADTKALADKERAADLAPVAPAVSEEAKSVLEQIDPKMKKADILDLVEKAKGA